MGPAIELSGARFKAGSREILKGINLKVNYGDFTAILGPNGSGKTTLLRTIMGFNRVSSGRVKVLGRELNNANIGEIRRKTGYVPQSLNIDRHFPILARDVIRFGAGDAAADEAAKELKITGILDRPFGLISGGEKQKVLLAMALSRRPELLLMDEPNLNLDMYAYRDFLSSVDRIHAKHGLTVVFVTHLISQIPSSCKRVVAVKEGRVAFESAAKGILKKKNHLELIYG
jgi:zinc/manganese transport system ATP-binding protein